jgi:hypothetical protein
VPEEPRKVPVSERVRGGLARTAPATTRANAANGEGRFAAEVDAGGRSRSASQCQVRPNCTLPTRASWGSLRGQVRPRQRGRRYQRPKSHACRTTQRRTGRRAPCETSRRRGLLARLVKSQTTSRLLRPLERPPWRLPAPLARRSATIHHVAARRRYRWGRHRARGSRESRSTRKAEVLHQRAQPHAGGIPGDQSRRRWPTQPGAPPGIPPRPQRPHGDRRPGRGGRKKRPQC